MATNPQQGGMFARYAGMNSSPVPPGYLESAQAQASMYANIGSNIAGMMQRKQDMEMKEKEFGLKKEEIEASKLSAKAAGDKAFNESRRLDITQQETNSKERERIAGERLKFMSQGLTQLDASIGDIQRQLDNPEDYKLTPEKIEKLKAKRTELYERKTGMSESYMKALDSSFAETNTEATKTPQQRYYEEWSKLPTGGRLRFGDYDITRRRQEGLLPGEAPKEAEKPNPSNASGPSNGGLGAVRTGLEGFVPSGIPTATKAFFAATPPPIVNPPSSNPPVVDGKPSTKIEGIPDYSSYHLKFDSANLPEIKLQGGGLAPVSFAPQRDKNTQQLTGIGLVVAPSTTSTGDPAIDADNRKKIRFAHVMKFIMDNNLAESIKPTEEERRVAGAMFGTQENAPILSKIWNAYALLSRDQNEEALNEPQFLTLNRAFEAKFGFNIDNFIEEGAEVNTNTINPSPIPELRKLHIDALSRQAELVKKAQKLEGEMPAEFRNDPTRDERETAVKALEKVRKQMKLAPLGSPYYQELKAKESSLESLIRENKIRFDTWKARYDMWEGKAKFYNELIRSEASVGEGLAVQISASRADAEFAEKAAPKLARMIGISPSDRFRYGGWKAPGVVNFPRLDVKEGNTRRFLSAPEWASWVRRTGGWDQVGPVVASLEASGRLPTEEQIKTIDTVHNEHMKLIPPLQGLATRFTELAKMNPLERAARQKMDKEFAAAGPLRLSVMAALRVAYTGGGNPSNFEQEMLLSAIPATDEVLSISNFNLQRIRLISVLSMINHAKVMMQNNNGHLDDDVIDSYNKQYAGIFGRKITLEDFTDFMNLDSVVSGRNTYAGTQGMSDRDERVKSSVSSALLGLSSLIEQKFK